MKEITMPALPGKWALRWVITRHEMRNIIRHPYYVVSLLIPIFMSLVFTILFPAIRDSGTLIVVVYDAGDSALTAALGQLPAVELQEVASETAVLESLTGDATGGLVIPADFDTAVAAGQTPELNVTINTDARSANIANLKRLVTEHVWAMRYGAPPANISFEEMYPAEATFPLLSSEKYLVLTLILLGISMTTLGILPQLMVDEKERGALPALMASPAEPSDLLIGRGTAVFLYAILLATTLLLMNQGWQGNGVVTAVAILLTTLMLIGLAFFLGLWSQSKQQCNTYTAIITIVINMSSWFAVVPLAGLGVLPGFFIRLLPTYYFSNTLVYSLSGDATWDTVGLNLAILALCAVAAFALLYWQSQRRPLQIG